MARICKEKIISLKKKDFLIHVSKKTITVNYKNISYFPFILRTSQLMKTAIHYVRERRRAPAFNSSLRLISDG